MAAVDRPFARKAIRIAVIGAGPVGLSLALHAARALPEASITIHDTRPVGVDPARDPRTLAMSLGSIQLLQRLRSWQAEKSEAITEVHVSQQAPELTGGSRARASGAAEATRKLPDPRVRIRAADVGVEQLGAVVSYGDIVAPLEATWLAAVAREPHRLFNRFDTTVASLENLPSREGPGVALVSLTRDDNGDGDYHDAAATREQFDLAIVAEGGVFSDQARKGLVHDYRQTAWVGKVTLDSARSGVAFERFTSAGPAALLPLPALPSKHVAAVAAAAAPATAAAPSSTLALGTRPASRAALVWCVPTDADPVRDLSDEQRVSLLNDIFHRDVGRITAIGPLKHFALGLNAERTLTDGRIVRIGNAAQTLHPVAGQGLNLGMRDAFELVLRLSKSPSVDAALRDIEWSRAPDRWAMIAVTDFLARSFTWQVPGFPAVRGLALAGLQMASPLKSFIARRMMFGRR